MDDGRVIAICDDNRSVAKLIADKLNRKGYSAEIFTDTCSMIKAAQDGRFAAMIVDYLMPALDGVAATKELRERGIDAPVVLTSGVYDQEIADAAADAGAMRWQMKPMSDRDLDEILHDVGLAAAERQQLTIARKAEEAQSARISSEEVDARVARLTPREREILEKLCDGAPNKLVAHNLGISIKTVELHRARVMQKMQATSFAELVRLAVRAGLVREDGSEPLEDELRDLRNENLWLKSKLMARGNLA